MAKALLARVGAQPTALIGRMSIGYSFLQTPFWWDTERSGGPVVEQVVQGSNTTAIQSLALMLDANAIAGACML